MLTPTRYDDPRDTYSKMKRRELQYLCKKEGRQFHPDMPADLLRALFRSNPPKEMPRPLFAGVVVPGGLRIPPYDVWLTTVFGQPSPVKRPVEGKQIDAIADLARQWKEQEVKPLPQRPKNEMAELRAECRRRGIKMARTDKLTDLRAKLDGQDAAQCG